MSTIAILYVILYYFNECAGGQWTTWKNKSISGSHNWLDFKFVTRIWLTSCQYNSNPTFNYPLSSFRQNNCNSKIHCDYCLFEIPLFEMHHSWFLSQKLLFLPHYFPDLHRPFYHKSTRAFILYKHIASFWQDASRWWTKGDVS